jgi:hypothetical protein
MSVVIILNVVVTIFLFLLLEGCCFGIRNLYEIREFVRTFQVENSRLVFLFFQKIFVFIFGIQNFP